MVRERDCWAWLNAAGERYERERHGPSDGRRSTQGGRHERLSRRQPWSHSSLWLRGTTHSLITCVSLPLSTSLPLCVCVCLSVCLSRWLAGSCYNTIQQYIYMHAYLFLWDTLLRSYIKKHTNTHRHTEKSNTTSKTVEKTYDIKKTNDYLPNILLRIVLLQRKRLHSKLNFELCLSVLKLGKPSSKCIEVTLYTPARVTDGVLRTLCLYQTVNQI